MNFSVRAAISLTNVLRVAALAALMLAETGCGDQFRPVAVPITPTPPNPASFHFVLSLSTNGPNNPGASTRIDVSGDTNVAVAQVGLGPSHAVLLPNGTDVYVTNKLEDTVSFFSPSNVTPVSTVSLPAGSAPVFLATQQNDTVYVASSGTSRVDAIATSTNVVTNDVGVGFHPVALAETGDAKKVYAVGNDDQGVGWVMSLNVIDKSPNRAVTGQAIAGKNTQVDASISSPVWVTARSDSARVYVLSSASGRVTTIDTLTDLPLGSVSVGAGANFMLYDSKRNRLYVTDPTANTMTMLDASLDPPNVLAVVPVQSSPLTVAALPDGSRLYVASAAVSGGNSTSQVTVINAADGRVRSTIPLSTIPAVCDPNTRFRLFTVASGDSSRVYVGNCDAGSTAIIRTQDDTAVLNLPAPVSALPPPTPGAQPPPQNPVFVLAGP
jgi:DNA-binding beta-propeller fold protein YncE